MRSNAGTDVQKSALNLYMLQAMDLKRCLIQEGSSSETFHMYTKVCELHCHYVCKE